MRLHPRAVSRPHRPEVDIPEKRFSQIPFDLQLFAGEKTEPATEKRREEARAQGNVPKSQDLDSVVVLLAAFLVLRYYGPEMIGILGQFLRFSIHQSATVQFDVPQVMSVFGQVIVVFLKCLSPLFVVVVISATTVNILQTGFMLTFDPLIPDLNRINPISGLENVFSWNAVGELVKSIFKILIVAYIPYSTLRDQFPLLVRFVQLEPIPAMIVLAKIIFTMAIKIILILLVLAIGDWFFQKWRYEENMKMSKEEIKEEFKQREGDPKVKAKIRERQRRLATRRMMEEVPKATVVVTNPTHIAVALRYEEGEDTAPRVVAMGTGLIAQKIREIAAEHGVPVLENKPLAQALHKSVDVGQVIPHELFEAVAEILAQVFRLRASTQQAI